MNDVNYSSIPASLQAESIWCCWRYEERDGQRTKVPYNPMTSGKAQSNNQSTFGTFQQACFACGVNGYDGIGIGLFGDVCAIDIDHCIESGAISDMASDIIRAIDSYTEVSPSGSGIRILFRAPGLQYDKAKYYIKNSNFGLEIYCAGMTNRFVTVTGHAVNDVDVNVNPSGLGYVLDTYMVRPQNSTQATPAVATVVLDMDDQTVIQKAMSAQNGARFQQLMSGDTSGDGGDDSKADISLCNILAFYCGGPEQIDRIFRSSGLMRPKWDEKRGDTTYGRMTIDNAVQYVSSRYGQSAQNQTVPAPIPQAAPAATVQATNVAQSQTSQPQTVTANTSNIGTPVGPANVMLVSGPKGLEKSSRNVMRILTQDPNLVDRIYYDQFRCCDRVAGQMPWPSEPGPRDWDNADDAMMRNYVENYIVGVPASNVSDAVSEIARHHAVDPLKEFLNGLKWDGTPRIDTAMHDYLGAVQNEWTARAFRHWLVGAVARGYEPGVKFDEMLILFGPQGKGKSTFVSRLVPDYDFFCENLTNIDNKDAMQLLKGKWIVNFDELLAQKRSDMREACKSFLVGRQDTYRPAYGRRVENIKRRCVFCGSTNEPYFLTDRTGNRRYLPVACYVTDAPKSQLIFDNSPAATYEFRQMVAEAVDIYRKGYVLAVTGDFKAMQDAELLKYLEEDSREGMIEDFLNSTYNDKVCVQMLSYEVLGGSKTPSPRETNELHRIMRNMPGWELYTSNNGRTKFKDYGLQTTYVRSGYRPPQTVQKNDLKGGLL